MHRVYVDPAGLEALAACRLIALDKHPGVRPIGVGECLRRLVMAPGTNSKKHCDTNSYLR